MRGLIALLVGPVLGETTPHFPLYLVEALLVELVALRVRRPLPFALASGRRDRHGRAGRRVGLDARLDAAALARRAAARGRRARAAMAIAGAFVGGWLGARLSRATGAVAAAGGRLAAVGDLRADRLRPAVDRRAAACAATVALAAADGNAEVRVDPADGADDAEWLTATSWQGGGLVVDRLRARRARRLPHDRAAPVTASGRR